ncbi:MAG: succinate--CoA ligase subunit alpha, partial [Nitrososphaeraceae archaeon]
MSLKFDLFNILIGKENDSDYKNKPVIIQGMTGSFGSTHTKLMKEYGTNIVAGVTPGKGGQSFEDIPVFNTVADAVKNNNSIEISGIFVPAPFFLNAANEALDNG